MGLQRIGDCTGVKVQSEIFRFVLHDKSAFDKGPVIEVLDGFVTVDFGDTIRRIALVEIARVIDTSTADEFFMTLNEGFIVANYQPLGLMRHRPPMVEAVTDNYDDLFSDLLGKLDEIDDERRTRSSLRKK
jgi:hypothetical protein